MNFGHLTLVIFSLLTFGLLTFDLSVLTQRLFLLRFLIIILMERSMYRHNVYKLYTFSFQNVCMKFKICLTNILRFLKYKKVY